jgi:hypothetical protein
MSPPLDRPALGRVVFVGAGPGSADLITLRGARALAQADVDKRAFTAHLPGHDRGCGSNFMWLFDCLFNIRRQSRPVPI